MPLTEKEINEYFKLKEKKDKQNKYLYNYIKNKIQNTKETNQEEYKKIMEEDINFSSKNIIKINEEDEEINIDDI